MALDFTEVIGQIKAGDTEAFGRFYEMTYNKVYFRAKHDTKSEQDAEDVLMQTYVEAYKSIHTLETPEAALSWLYTITYSMIARMYRGKRYEKETLLTEETAELFENEESKDNSGNPELSLEEKTTAKIISECLDELSEEQRMVVIAHYYDGVSITNIAKTLDCSENTVKSRLFQARKKLKTIVEEKEKKGGYRLHAITIPILIWAIKLLEKDSKLSAFAAEKAYGECCKQLGVEATKLESAATSASAASAPTGTAAGASGVAGTAASSTAASIGITKILLIATAIVLGGVGAYAGVHAIQKSQTEVIEETVVSEPVETVMETTEEPETETKEIENSLTETAQKQISSFLAAAYQCGYTDGAPTTPDDCLLFVSDYIDMVNFTWDDSPADSDMLPFDWANYNVTEDQVREFSKAAFGVTIPDDYTFRIEREWGMLAIEDGKLVSTFDGRTLQIQGDLMDDPSENDDVMYGKFYWFDPEKTTYYFALQGEPGGNPDILGGLTVHSIQISESPLNDHSDSSVSDGDRNLDFTLISQLYSNVLNDICKKGISSDYEHYFIYDIDKNDLPDLIVEEGTSNADYKYVIYTVHANEIMEYGSMTWGADLFGENGSTMLYSRYIQMEYEIVRCFDVTSQSETTVSTADLQMTDDYDFISVDENSYAGGYTFPSTVEKLTPHELSQRDEATVYNLITAEH